MGNSNLFSLDRFSENLKRLTYADLANTLEEAKVWIFTYTEKGDKDSEFRLAQMFRLVEEEICNRDHIADVVTDNPFDDTSFDEEIRWFEANFREEDF